MFLEKLEELQEVLVGMGLVQVGLQMGLVQVEVARMKREERVPFLA
jgi:hypothetical protein